MLNEYFDSDSDEDDTSDEVGWESESLTNIHADDAADDGHDERGDTNDDDWWCDGSEGFHAHTLERDSYGKGIDAGSYCQQQNDGELTRVERVASASTEMVDHHLYADNGQQTECNPMVVGFDIFAVDRDAIPSEEWHQRLKDSKTKGHDEDGGCFVAFDD